MMLLAGPVQFDRTVFDFGKISEADGEKSCTFTVTNTSEEPLSIFAVVTSCGCTAASWTKETIAPGAAGKIEVTYSNDEGPVAFDKKITVYTSSQSKPYVLHVKGTVVKKNGK